MQRQGQKYPFWGHAETFHFLCALWPDKIWNLWTFLWLCSEKNFWFCLEILSYAGEVILKYFWKNWNNPAQTIMTQYAHLLSVLLCCWAFLSWLWGKLWDKFIASWIYVKNWKLRRWVALSHGLCPTPERASHELRGWETCAHVKLLCKGQYQVVTPAKFSVKMS